MKLPPEFRDAFLRLAAELGAEPAQLLQAQTRAIEEYELDDIVREKVAIVRAEGEARAKLGRSAGGRARAVKLSKL